MKKILAVLASVNIISSVGITAVSCTNKNMNSTPNNVTKDDNSEKKIPSSKEKDKEPNKEDKVNKSIENEIQGDEPIKDDKKEKDLNSSTKNSNNSSSLDGIEKNILVSIEKERDYIYKYNEWLQKSKGDDVPHFFNPNDPNEILELGRTKVQNKKGFEWKLKQIPKYVTKVPNYLPKVITNLEKAFQFNENKEILGIDKWDVLNVKNMFQMFYGAKNFNMDISNWKTDNVENMDYMFNDAVSFNKNLSKWNVKKTPFPVNFAKNSGLQKDKSLLPEFKNKNSQ
ncbi:BspA family leucine-rich repeat surface protein [Mycoplasma capricolum subsp. capricolum]|uniref:BspA family leucine-rich repeat surface protein n=1 Tax=Mycoplasma capricolum TaxID=2095 RepID=UPI003DA4FB81